MVKVIDSDSGIDLQIFPKTFECSALAVPCIVLLVNKFILHDDHLHGDNTI
jgi:hypothetical protein